VRSIFLSPEAEDDLIQAAEYLDGETGNAVFGHRLHDEIDHVLDLIAENPLDGTGAVRTPERAARVSIFLRLHDDVMEVVRVLHQRQDVEQEVGLKRGS
jgi:plasmid stabilization system protein ParE